MINDKTFLAIIFAAAPLAAPWALAERIPVDSSAAGAGEGVVIASTRMGVGPALADPMGLPADCGGPGLNVMVTSAGEQQRWLYDANGEPCTDATLMYDGGSALGSRMADPAVQIGFIDPLGGLPQAETLPALPRIQVSRELLPAQAAAGPAKTVGAPSDLLGDTIKQWQSGLTEMASDAPRVQTIAQTEATLAAVRELDRQTTSLSTQRDQVEALAAQLREKERELAAAEARAKTSKLNSQQQRNLAEATLSKAQQAEQNMRADLRAAQERLATLEAQNKQLAASKARQEKVYEQRIATLGDDLRTAEQKAQASRQELIMQAAAKIAEAEALANAARVAEADAKAREAARLKQEAETMLNRALDLANNKAVIAADLAEATPKAAPMPLMEVPVVIHATDQTLSDLLASILKQAAPQAGEWKADFQLTTANSYILAEKWSLTAEAPVKALLDNLTAQIKAAHGVTLAFTQFPQSRLVVVTDN
ncbi:MAG: hypothetical protein H6922_05700 [Pseudomonadaceae bacterium]|nr:hypothetical protein [Pseudomonadaceae bacterium]